MYTPNSIDTDQNSLLSMREIIASIPGHVYWLDCDNVFQGCNNLQARNLGFKDWTEVIGKNLTDVYPPELAALYAQNNIAIQKSGEPQVFEEPGVLPDGTRIIGLSHKHPLFDKQGKVIGIIGNSLEITKKNEEYYKLQKEKNALDVTLDNIITHLPGEIYWLDNNNVFLGCNDAQAKSAGFSSRHDVVGKSNYELPWKHQANALNEINNRVMRTGETHVVEEQLTFSDGRIVDLLSKKSPLKDIEGNVIGIMGVSLDITDRKKAEEALKIAEEKTETADRMKSIFLNNISHDLRTPVAAMIACVEMLKVQFEIDNINNAEVTKFTEGISDSAQELLRFLNEVIDVVHLSSNTTPVVNKCFNLDDTIEKLIKLHQPIALQKGLEFTYFVDPKIPKTLIGDSGRIYRILLELLSNAFRFTKQGKVDILIKLAKKSDRHLVIQCAVKDTGRGFPKEKQEELFMRFKKLIPSHEPTFMGAGLGLAIVKQLMSDLDGEIHVESPIHDNQGAQFICLIPVTEPLLSDVNVSIM